MKSQIYLGGIDGRLPQPKLLVPAQHSCLFELLAGLASWQLERMGACNFLPQVLDPQRRVVLLDTTRMGAAAAEARAGEAVTNTAEAGVLCAIVAALVAGRVAAGSIGIISPYKAQVRCPGVCTCGSAHRDKRATSARSAHGLPVKQCRVRVFEGCGVPAARCISCLRLCSSGA